MDFKQLLQLAGDNSAFAKKKLDRLDQTKRDSVNVSSAAVAKYLEKQKKLREQQKAEEEEARRKRIKARLESNLGKKKETKQTTREAVDKHKEKDEVIFKVHESHKVKDKKSHYKEEREHTKRSSNPKHDSKSDKIKTEDGRSKHDSDHRKEKNRTMKANPNNKKPLNTPSTSSGLSFADLMKVAKDNAAGIKRAKRCTNTLKRPAPTQHKKEMFDPDRNIKTKVRKKDAPVVNNHAKHSSKHGISSSHYKLKHQDGRDVNKQKQKIKDRNHVEETRLVQKKENPSNQPVRRGVITQTISSTKTMLPHRKSNKTFKQVKFGGGIAAQNSNRRDKRSANDIEDEFSREARLLEKKRRLFELRRIHGNSQLEEEDLYGDYDLDEDDEDYSDFIDDSEYAGDVSKHIRSIFNYDRRRYSDSDDDDLAKMESSYSQIEKEEARSSRIAKIEDAYEKMKEEEELSRQKMRKKQAQKR